MFQNETAIQCYSCLLEQKAVKSNQAQTLRNLKGLGCFVLLPFSMAIIWERHVVVGSKRAFLLFRLIEKVLAL